MPKSIILPKDRCGDVLLVCLFFPFKVSNVIESFPDWLTAICSDENTLSAVHVNAACTMIPGRFLPNAPGNLAQIWQLFLVTDTLCVESFFLYIKNKKLHRCHLSFYAEPHFFFFILE